MAEAASSLSGRRPLVVALAIVAIAAVGVPLYLLRDNPPELTDLGVLPKFALVDQDGRPFTDAALRGHATIVSFIFTRCDTACPITSMKMAKIQDKIAGDDGVQLLSISVDPTYDTPERLAAYAAKYRADAAKWRFVTGGKDAVLALVEGGFMANMQPDGTIQKNGAASIAHRAEFFLIDGELHLRGIYAHDDVSRIDELIRAARYLARTTK